MILIEFLLLLYVEGSNAATVEQLGRVSGASATTPTGFNSQINSPTPNGDTGECIEPRTPRQTEEVAALYRMRRDGRAEARVFSRANAGRNIQRNIRPPQTLCIVGPLQEHVVGNVNGTVSLPCTIRFRESHVVCIYNNSDAYRPPTPQTPKTFDKGALTPQLLENLKFYFEFCHP